MDENSVSKFFRNFRWISEYMWIFSKFSNPFIVKLFPKFPPRNFPGISKFRNTHFLKLFPKLFVLKILRNLIKISPKFPVHYWPKLFSKFRENFLKILLELIFSSYKDSSKLLQNLPTIFSFLQESFRFLVLPKFLWHLSERFAK